MRRDRRRRQGRLRKEAAEEDADGADEYITEETHAEDVDHEGGGVAPEEVVVGAEDELVVPGLVGAAVCFDAGRELVPGVHPRHRVRLHACDGRDASYQRLAMAYSWSRRVSGGGRGR